MASALSVTRWGAGPPAILVHGSLFGAETTWSAQRPMGERWTLIVPDRRGFGASPDTEREDYLVDAKDISALLEQPAHLVGHSYGGVVVMLVAAAMPGLVRSLTVIEAPVYHVAAHLPAVGAYLERSRERYYAGPRDPDAFLRELTARRGTPAQEGPFSPSLLRGAALMIGQRPPWEAELPLDALAAASFPKLVVSGGHQQVHETTSNVLADRVGAHRAVIPGRGHAVQRTGEPFNRVLQALWEEAERGGAVP